MVNPIGIGVLGLGKHGERYVGHLERDLPGLRVVAVSRRDDRQGRSRAASLDARYYSDVWGLAADRAVDAVVSVVPPALHPEVVRACAAPGPNREDTWINDEILSLYGDLHALGRAHCVETWLDGKLAGGLYGVSLGAAFFGESMFSLARDASKVALVHLVARLVKGGYKLLDTQFVTDHLTQFGVVELPRVGYRELLSEALDDTATFEPDLPQPELDAFLQSVTQTS